MPSPYPPRSCPAMWRRRRADATAAGILLPALLLDCKRSHVTLVTASASVNEFDGSFVDCIRSYVVTSRAVNSKGAAARLQHFDSSPTAAAASAHDQDRASRAEIRNAACCATVAMPAPWREPDMLPDLRDDPVRTLSIDPATTTWLALATDCNRQTRGVATVRVPRYTTSGVEFVGYHALAAKPGFKLALQVVNDRWYLYVTHFWEPGLSVLDVTDPSAMELGTAIEGPEHTATWQVQQADGLLVQGLEARPPAWGGSPENV